MNKIFRNLAGFEVICPNVDGAEVSDDIVFTTRALDKIIEELNANYRYENPSTNRELVFIRLKMATTIQSAKQYCITFEDKLQEIDRVFELRKIRIVIDRKSLFLFMGIFIDYIETEQGSGFVFHECNDEVVDKYLKEYFVAKRLKALKQNSDGQIAILIASNNIHKLEEIRRIANDTVKNVKVIFYNPSDLGIDILPDEKYDTLEENAKIKAEEFFKASKISCIADDSGLEIDVLGGLPGVHSARFADEHNDKANRIQVLKLMKGEDNRKAHFRTVLVYKNDEEEKCFEGVCEGQIIGEERGDSGFGYDPIFLPAQIVPQGEERTFAEMTEEEKNAVSHRGRAVRAFCEWLNEKYANKDEYID